MYAAGCEHANRAPSIRFLERAREGEVEACTSTEVLQEILYRYSSLRRLELARTVYDLFVEVCPVILGVTLADTDRSRDLVCSGAAISARDAFHAVVMIQPWDRVDRNLRHRFRPDRRHPPRRSLCLPDRSFALIFGWHLLYMIDYESFHRNFSQFQFQA